MRIVSLIAILCLSSQAFSEVAPNGNDYRIRVQLSPANEARLASQMEGRIVALPKGLGESFNRGDLLVSFACDHQEAAFAAAEAQRVRAEKSLESQQQLADLQAVSEMDLEMARAELAQARAEVARTRAKVLDCRVKAPFSGSVVKLSVNQWETVGQGTILIHIVNQDDLEIDAVVPSAWLRWLSPDTPFTIQVDELGATVDAKVVAIGARIDPVSQTVPIKAQILSDVAGLLPGMSGYAQFQPSDTHE